MTSNTAPAHPHATGVAVYPALFSSVVVVVVIVVVVVVIIVVIVV